MKSDLPPTKNNPGDSTDTKLQEILDTKIFMYIVIIGFCCYAVFLEWYRFFFPSQGQPVLTTIIALITSIVALVKFWRNLKIAQQYKQGRDGERIVGQYLEDLRNEFGAFVLHDIPDKDFNVDHVVIHTTGIYVIETKTLSKSKKQRRRSELIYDGKTIKIGNKDLPRNPINQVKMARKFIRETLQGELGAKKHKITPIVLFPGWFVQMTENARNSDVWVLNPKQINYFIANGNEVMSSDEVKKYYNQLSQYIKMYKQLKRKHA